jgi:hypothetical protein
LAAGSQKVFIRNIITRDFLYPPLISDDHLEAILLSDGGEQFITINSKYISFDLDF